MRQLLRLLRLLPLRPLLTTLPLRHSGRCGHHARHAPGNVSPCEAPTVSLLLSLAPLPLWLPAALGALPLLRGDTSVLSWPRQLQPVEPLRTRCLATLRGLQPLLRQPVKKPKLQRPMQMHQRQRQLTQMHQRQLTSQSLLHRKNWLRWSRSPRPPVEPRPPSSTSPPISDGALMFSSHR